MSTSVYKLETFNKMGHKYAQRRTRTTPEKVKRSLFGPVDHDANRLFIDTQLSMDYHRGCRKWNFNFREEVPLEEEDGDYLWMTPSSSQQQFFVTKKRKQLQQQENASSAYYFQPIDTGSGPRGVVVDLAEPIRPIARSPEGQSRTTAHHHHRIQRQSQITDYMVKSKRPMAAVHLKEMSADERPKKIRKTLNCSS